MFAPSIMIMLVTWVTLACFSHSNAISLWLFDQTSRS